MTIHNAPVFPAGRYGRRRQPDGRRHRAVLVVGAVVAVGAATAIGVRGYQLIGDPDFQPQTIAYEPLSDSAFSVRFQVNLPDGAAAVCSVRARDRAGAVVGRVEAPVPAGAPVQEVVLATSGRGFVGEAVRCRRG
ncbi:DUF4307 domain-containing protein [Pilimelia columellifera]|uniref:DUF4307 domain-containing protein n=1 Tax=Pilimelia columellifera subsp. columellifera TaxID=706583 RepID=A0ABN3NKS4_9ACTN